MNIKIVGEHGYHASNLGEFDEGARPRGDRWLGRVASVGASMRRLMASGRRLPMFRDTEAISGQAFGTTYRIAIGGPCCVGRDAVRQVVECDLRRVDALMSVYRADSDIGRLNLAAPGDWVPIATETAQVIQQAIDIGRRSQGAYDITVGALVNLWGFGPGRRPSAVPSSAQIAAAQSCAGLDKIEVRFDPPAARKRILELRVDLSSIAKGFAVDLVAKSLERIGINDCCVEVGGEIRARGHNARGAPWQVAVETPEAGRRAVQRIVPLSGGAMATSGDYRQYFEKFGIRYSHIVDPRTGFPIKHALASVAVVDQTCTRADAWATALLVAGPEAGLRLAEEENLSALFIIRTEEGFQERCSAQFRELKTN
jgi:FAD:protein FMN transferase